MASTVGCSGLRSFYNGKNKIITEIIRRGTVECKTAHTNCFGLFFGDTRILSFGPFWVINPPMVSIVLLRHPTAICHAQVIILMTLTLHKARRTNRWQQQPLNTQTQFLIFIWIKMNLFFLKMEPESSLCTFWPSYFNGNFASTHPVALSN